MSQRLLIIVCVSLAVLLPVASQSSGWLMRNGASTLARTTLGWYFNVSLPASGVFWDSQVCRQLPGCASPFLSCCSSCDQPPPANAGCVCPDRSDHACFDGSATVPGSASPLSPRYYAIPVRQPACSSFVIVLHTLNGDADLHVQSANPFYPALLANPGAASIALSTYTFTNSTRQGSDEIFVCQTLGLDKAGASEAISASTIHVLNDGNSSFSWIYLIVDGKGVSEYQLSISTDLRIPLGQIPNRVPATLQCGNGSVTNSSSGNQLFKCSSHSRSGADRCELSTFKSSSDSPFFYHASLTGVDQLLRDSNGTSPSGLTLRLPIETLVSSGSRSVLLPWEAVEWCHIQIGDLVSGASFTPLPVSISLTADAISAVPLDLCTEENINGLSNQIDLMLASLRTQVSTLGNTLDSVAYIYGSLISSEYWQACERLISSIAHVESTGAVQELQTSACVAPIDSQEWLSDPCCNEELTSMCCAPRTISVEVTAPIVDDVSACQTPRCSSSVATSLLSTQSDRQFALTSCQGQLASRIGDPRLFADPSEICSDLLDSYRTFSVACGSDNDCYTACGPSSRCLPAANTDEFNQALQACLLNSTYPDVLALMLRGQDPNATFSANFFREGCDQAGRSSPDPTLNTSSACEAAYACNSDPNLSQAECEGLPQFMCASCPGNRSCTEFSRAPGCAFFPAITSLSECRKRRNTEFRNGQCYQSGQSRSQCLREDCSKQWTGADRCPQFCWSGWWLSNQSCTCPGDGLVPPGFSQPFAACGLRYWTTRTVPTSRCAIGLSPELCLGVSASNNLIPGAAYLDENGGFLNDQASCESAAAAGSVCSDSSCSDCSDPSCGECSDHNKNGYCWFPFTESFQSVGAQYGCPSDKRQALFGDGCQDMGRTQNECLTLGGIWRPPSVSKDICESYSSCFEPFGIPFQSTNLADPSAASEAFVFYNQKSNAECAKCGQTSVSAFKWIQPTLIPTSDLAWVRREWKQNVFQWGTSFDRAAFQSALAAARSEFIFLSLQSAISCLSSQERSAFSLLACDCAVGSSSAGCYGSVFGFDLINTQVCSNFAQQLVVPTRLVVDISRETRFADGCSALKIDSLGSSSFAKQRKTVVSSAFVESLQLRPLSIVKNNNGVTVGHLASDVYRVSFSNSTEDAELTGGAIRLCVPVDGSLGRQSGWNQLGVASARLKANPKAAQFKSTRLRLVAPNQTNVDFQCFEITEAGFYALDWEKKSSNSASYFETLSAQQQAALVIAIIVYCIVFLITSFAFANFFLWLLIQKKRFTLDNFNSATNFGLLWLCSLIRWIYFSIVISGTKMPTAVNILLVESPLFFFFSVLTMVALKWLQVARSSARLKKKGLVTFLPNVLAGFVNFLMYGCLIIFVILASVGVEDQSSPKCSLNEPDDVSILSIVYHVLIAFICAVIGISFITLGLIVTVKLIRLGGAQQRKRFFQFTSVASACAIAMILQAILVLIAAAVQIPPIVAVLILIVVEAIPILLFVWTWNKPLSLWRVLTSVSTSFSSSRTDSGTSSTTGTSQSGSSADQSSGGSASDSTSSTSSGGVAAGIARLWSLGTDSFNEASLAEEE